MSWCGLLVRFTAVGLLSCAWGCTKLLDTSATQCRSNLDCQRFGAASCDVPKGVCVAAGTTHRDVLDAHSAFDEGPAGTNPEAGGVFETPGSAAQPDAESFLDGGETFGVDGEAPPCLGPLGCFSCAPVIDSQFFVACTDSICVPFDNRARLTNLNPDGSLKPLP